MDKTILLFEDECETGDELLNILQRCAGQSEYKVVWFKRGFDSRAGRPIYPVSVETGFEGPIVYGVTKTGRRRLDSKLIWWQSHFDAAILDIYLESRSKPVGYDFAEWLEHAGFKGPVALVSQLDRDVRLFKTLDILPLHKLGDANWTSRAIDHVLRQSPKGKSKKRSLLVNYLGRDPNGFFADFFEQSGGNPQDWRSLYFGTDDDFEKHLRKFFDLKPYDVDNPLHPISELDRVLKAADKTGRKPKVIFVDCKGWRHSEGEKPDEADRLTDSLAKLVSDAFSALSSRPIGLILGKVDALEKQRSALAENNAMFVPREQLRSYPSLWAGETVEHFALAYSRVWEAGKKFNRPKSSLLPAPAKKDGKAKKTEKGKRIMVPPQPWPTEVLYAGTQMLEALLPAYMMARSQYRLAGDSNIPVSLADWIGTADVKPLNTNFCHELDDILQQLKRGRVISEQQFELYLGTYST